MANEYRSTSNYIEVAGAVITPFETTSVYLEVVGTIDAIPKASNVYLEVVAREAPSGGSEQPAQRMFIIA